MYKLKDVVKRGSALLGVAGLLAGVGASAMPTFVSADSLNPLYERSLTLSSSSPGWSYSDGSGNTYDGTTNPGHSLYAAPNTGANGKQTGETLSFKVSSTATIKAFDTQFCTSPSGNCLAPGDDGFDTSGGTGSYTRNADDSSHADYNITSSASAGTASTWTEGDYAAILASTDKVPAPSGTTGQYVVLVNGTQSTGWTLTASSKQGTIDPDDGTFTPNSVGDGTSTGKNNYFILGNTGGVSLTAGDQIQIILYATNGGYITNPGSGAFFARLNTYTNVTETGAGTLADPHVEAVDWNDIKDGGVTVANVMNESITIQTKVLETMDFSVGTVDPDTLSDAQLSALSPAVDRSTCNPILPNVGGTDGLPHNVLAIGDPTAENSLSTSHTFSTHSYFRLSSNSSNGATVYYSGVTLSNTEGDQIDAIGPTAHTPSIGTEQFGLALDNGTSSDNYAVNYAFDGNSKADGSGIALEQGADSSAAGYSTTGGEDGSGLSQNFQTYQTANSGGVHVPQLSPLEPAGDSDTGVGYYGGGDGYVNTVSDIVGTGSTGSPQYPGHTHDTSFAFDPTSNTVPVALASEDNQVVDCVTGKVRYIANIAATTPAGIYTTKINYIAAPQY